VTPTRHRSTGPISPTPASTTSRGTTSWRQSRLPTRCVIMPPHAARLPGPGPRRRPRVPRRARLPAPLARVGAGDGVAAVREDDRAALGLARAARRGSRSQAHRGRGLVGPCARRSGPEDADRPPRRSTRTGPMADCDGVGGGSSASVAADVRPALRELERGVLGSAAEQHRGCSGQLLGPIDTVNRSGGFIRAIVRLLSGD
jgi:hypothetical protein